MGSMSIWHWIVVLAWCSCCSVAARSPTSWATWPRVIKSFKKGMAEDETPRPPARRKTPRPLPHQVSPAPEAEKKPV